MIFLKFVISLHYYLLWTNFLQRRVCKQVIHVVIEISLLNSGRLHHDAWSLGWRGENAATKNLCPFLGLLGMDWVSTSSALSVIYKIRLLRPLTLSFQPFKFQVSAVAKALFSSSAHYGAVFSCLDEKDVHLMGQCCPTKL